MDDKLTPNGNVEAQNKVFRDQKFDRGGQGGALGAADELEGGVLGTPDGSKVGFKLSTVNVVFEKSSTVDGKIAKSDHFEAPNEVLRIQKIIKGMY